MLFKLWTRLTYANVMATIAVFVALGGSSYAAIKVTGKNVTDSSLTGKDVKNSSLTTSDVRNGSLLAGDFKSGQLPAGMQGSKGDSGSKGDTGTPGQNGSPGVSGYEIISHSTPNDSTTPKMDLITCPGSKRLLGATSEAIADDLDAPVASQGGHMVEDFGYQAYAAEIGTYTGSWTLSVSITCANVSL